MPKDGTATRVRILDAAERLVITHGYAATSLDQVIAEAQTSKGAFFHHFASKLELARVLVQRYAEADVANLEAALEHAAGAGGSPADRVDAFLGYFEERADELMSEQSSCLYVAILTERALVNDGTSEPIEGAVVAWRRGIAGLLEPALPDGADVDVDALADHVFVTFEGAFLLARGTGDAGHMRRQLAVLRRLVGTMLRA